MTAKSFLLLRLDYILIPKAKSGSAGRRNFMYRIYHIYKFDNFYGHVTGPTCQLGAFDIQNVG